MEHIADLIGKDNKPIFSFELLPPLKGKGVEDIFDTIDLLREFDPRYINITTHHSENIYKEDELGYFKKVNIRRRPGTVAIAAAIQNKYGIRAVPHLICTGFSQEETEYALIDLKFLGVSEMLILRGDVNKLDAQQRRDFANRHATDLQKQVENFNKGISFDGTTFTPPQMPFNYGMACYPEKHEESPNMESEVYYTKLKADGGADYVVTQMFFNNHKYFEFVDRCRAEGITIPIIPGIKPIHQKNQLNILPKTFGCEIPGDLEKALRKCKDDADAVEIGIEWSLMQSKELIDRGVSGIHFYALGAAESVRRIAHDIF